MNAEATFCRDIVRLVFTSPRFDEVVHIGQFVFNLFRVGRWFIHFVDGKHNWDTGCRSMVDGLDGLGHHIIVGRHNNNGDVGNLRTAGTHGGKGFVARSIEEGDFAAIFEFNIVGPDMLGNTARFAGNYIGFTDVVEQRCFTVVDMAHHRHDRRAREQVFGAVFFFLNGFLNFDRNKFDFVAKFIGHYRHGFGIKPLVDRNEHPQRHTGTNNLGWIYIHHGGQFAYGNELGYLDNIFVHLGTGTLFGHPFGKGHTLVAAVLRTFGFLSFGG